MTYRPPFTVSSAAISKIAEISALIERYVIRMEQEDSLLLRKANRIKTIQGSLAIEGNTLSEDQITAILEGKRIVAPLREIQEVKNAIKTYELYSSLNRSRHSRGLSNYPHGSSGRTRSKINVRPLQLAEKSGRSSTDSQLRLPL